MPKNLRRNYVVVETACATKQAAEKLAEVIVCLRLAACVQVQKIESFYIWEGKETKESEWLLRIKTREDIYTKLEKTILENHSYELPEIITVLIERGSDNYLRWIDSRIDI